MKITVHLPNGKELEIEKGVDGCQKLFTTLGGEVVADYGDRVIKFGNHPFVSEHEREERE